MTLSNAAKLKTLEDENRRLKRLLAEAMLDVSALKDVLAKKLRRPVERREVALRFMAYHGLSQVRATSEQSDGLFAARTACALAMVDPKMVRRAPAADNPEVRARLRALAAKRRCFGYRRLGVLHKREIVRQEPPRAARPQDVKNRLHSLALVGLARSPAGSRVGGHGRDRRPLGVGQVAGIGAAAGTAGHGPPASLSPPRSSGPSCSPAPRRRPT